MNDFDNFFREHAEYAAPRAAHWDRMAARVPGLVSRRYHRRLAEVYRQVVGGCDSVLEISCGHGDLVASIEAPHRVGAGPANQPFEPTRP